MLTFVGDTVLLDIETSIILTDYSLSVRYRKPDGVEGEWEAAINPSFSTRLIYTTLPSDLDQAGKWLIQAYAYISTSNILHGNWCELEVHEHITPDEEGS